MLGFLEIQRALVVFVAGINAFVAAWACFLTAPPQDAREFPASTAGDYQPPFDQMHSPSMRELPWTTQFFEAEPQPSTPDKAPGAARVGGVASCPAPRPISASTNLRSGANVCLVKGLLYSILQLARRPTSGRSGDSCFGVRR